MTVRSSRKIERLAQLLVPWRKSSRSRWAVTANPRSSTRFDGGAHSTGKKVHRHPTWTLLPLVCWRGGLRLGLTFSRFGVTHFRLRDQWPSTPLYPFLTSPTISRWPRR